MMAEIFLYKVNALHILVNQGSNKTVPVQFFVVKTEASPIIGLKTCEQLNLIKRVYKFDVGYDSMLENYDIFGDLG